MTWLAWRQFRTQAAIAAGALLAILIALALSGHHVTATFSSTGDGELTGIYVWLRLLGTVLIGIPAAIGAFWGAPLIARELDDHTHRLAWTQSVTRTRWLLVKLAVTAIVTAVAVAAFSAAFTWWSAPIDATGSRIGTANFAQRGIIPIAYALFALALGTLLGAILQRILPAMAATLGAYFAVRLSIQQLVRPHLLAPVELTTATFSSDSGGAWTLSSRTVDAAGHTLNGVDSYLAQACSITRQTPDPEAALTACAHQIGVHDIAEVHPASHFWTLQTLEASIFLVLAACAVASCIWWIRHRSA